MPQTSRASKSSLAGRIPGEIDGDVGGVEVMTRTDALTGLIADNLAVETAVSAVRP